MAWPLVVGMLSFTVMGVTDTLLMGNVSTPAQAGVGFASILTWVSMSFFRGLCSGPQSLVAAADGARDRRRVLRAAGAGVAIGAVAGAVVMLLLEGCRRVGLSLLLEDQAVIVEADAYLMFGVWAPLFSLTAFGLMSGLQGLGDTKARMWAGLIGNAVNIVLDLVLIFGWGPIPAMGAAGAALATAIGAVVMLLVYAWRFRQLVGPLVAPDREVMSSSLAVGIPSGAQAMLGSVAFMVTTVFIARAGAVHLAANQVLIHIISVSFLPGFGVGEAGGILVGRALGAGDRALAGRTIVSARTVALAVMGVCGVFFAVGGGWLAGFFNPDSEVQALIVLLLLIAAVFQLFDALAMVHLCVLRAAGDTRFTLVLTTAAAWIITVPAAWFLGDHLGWGAPGAWLGITLEIAVLAVVSGWRVRGVASGRVGRLDLLLGANDGAPPRRARVRRPRRRRPGFRLARALRAALRGRLALLWRLHKRLGR